MFGHFGYIEASEHTFADQLFESFGRVRFEVVGPSRSSSIQNDVNHEVFSQDSHHMGVSINGGTPKSSILMGSSLLNQPLFFSPIYGNPHILLHHHWATYPDLDFSRHRVSPWHFRLGTATSVSLPTPPACRQDSTGSASASSVLGLFQRNWNKQANYPLVNQQFAIENSH